MLHTKEIKKEWLLSYLDNLFFEYNFETVTRKNKTLKKNPKLPKTFYRVTIEFPSSVLVIDFIYKMVSVRMYEFEDLFCHIKKVDHNQHALIFHKTLTYQEFFEYIKNFRE